MQCLRAAGLETRFDYAGDTAKEIDLHSPILAGGNGCHTVKALFQKPPTAEIGLFICLKHVKF